MKTKTNVFKKILTCIFFLALIILNYYYGVRALDLWINEGKGTVYEICSGSGWCHPFKATVFDSPQWLVILFTILNVVIFAFILPIYFTIILVNLIFAFTSDKFKWIGLRNNEFTNKIIIGLPFGLLILYALL